MNIVLAFWAKYYCHHFTDTIYIFYKFYKKVEMFFCVQERPIGLKF